MADDQRGNYDTMHRLDEEAACPECHAVLDAASGGDRRPSAGDLSVCLHCATPLTFTDDAGHVARLGARELAALPAPQRRELLRVMDAARALRALLSGDA